MRGKQSATSKIGGMLQAQSQQGRTNQFMYRIADSDGLYTANNGLTVHFTALKQYIRFRAQRSYVLSGQDVYIEVRIDQLGSNSLELWLESVDGQTRAGLSSDGIVKYYSHGYDDVAVDCPELGFSQGDIVQFLVHRNLAQLQIFKNGVYGSHPELSLARKGSRVVEFTLSGSAYVFIPPAAISINFVEPYFIVRPQWVD